MLSNLIMKLTMNRTTLKTKPLSAFQAARRPDHALCPIAVRITSTLQGESQPRIEISQSRRQLKEVRWLFDQYGEAKPGWVRMRFITNRRRTKLLNDILANAGLDEAWCLWVADDEEWSTLLHEFWHQLVRARS